MRILIASDTYVYQTSGASNMVIALARGLRALGHDVRVLAPADKRSSFREGDDFFLRSVPVILYPDIRLCPERSDPLLKELAEWKPDIIHLHTEASMSRFAHRIAKETGAPLVMTAHTDWAQFFFGRFCRTGAVRVMMKTAGKRIYRGVDTVILPSEKARSFPQVQGFRGREAVWVPNGIPLERYAKTITPEERAALYASVGLEDRGCTIVMITRVSREKNILEILRYLPALAEEVPEAQLVIAGDGPDRRHLERWCARHGVTDRVKFVGRIPPDEVYRYYAMGDLFVSASTFEVHSLSCLEAMAVGLPMICREDDSLRGVLEDGVNGFVYHTEEEFVSAVARLTREADLRASMHAASLERAQRFSLEEYVRQTMRVYEKVLAVKEEEEKEASAEREGED